MQDFTIRELERLSGIKAHTLRTWERRYQFPVPQRRQGERSYSIAELKEILDIVLLNKYGHKISSLLSLSAADRQQRLIMLVDEDARRDRAIHSLIISMHRFEVQDFEDLLQSCFRSWPYSSVIDEVIYPFLKRTELFWQGRRRTEEHLVVTALRRKMLWAIEKIRSVSAVNKTVVLFLPDTRQLDLGLLYIHHRLARAGVQVIYLGSDVATSDLRLVCEKMHPNFFFTYLSNRSLFTLRELSAFAEAFLAQAPLVVSMYPKEDTPPAQEFSHIKLMSFDEAVRFLSEPLVRKLTSK